jgi:bacterial/archaeal transporter family protein
MVWVVLALVSAFLLGIYDLLKKTSLKENAVIPVLFFSTLTSAIIFLPILLVGTFGNVSETSPFHFHSVSWLFHIQIAIKSLIVGSSWVLAYFAVKNLPITIVSPIRSSGPIWTVFGALLIFGEQLNLWQWVGVILTIGFYYLFGLSGRKEGISFRTNKWVLYMTMATIIGSASGLYDKYLISIAHYNRIQIQAWYHIYMVPLMLSLLLFIWYPNRHKYDVFKWRYTIPLIGICLTVADFIYFWSLSYPGALVAIVSTVRRGSVIISFSLGAIIFKEKNIKLKAFILVGILIGIAIIILGGKH